MARRTKNGMIVRCANVLGKFTKKKGQALWLEEEADFEFLNKSSKVWVVVKRGSIVKTLYKKMGRFL